MERGVERTLFVCFSISSRLIFKRSTRSFQIYLGGNISKTRPFVGIILLDARSKRVNFYQNSILSKFNVG